ncbi:hypothetical protein ACVWXL_005177 [Bradyrhizobium sp. GM22.5]
MAKKSIVERISDTVKEIVDTASTAAADAMKPDPEAVAGVTNEQVYIPEATDAAAVPPPIITRKKRVPAPMRANRRVAAARTKKTVSAAKKSAKKPAKTPPKEAAKKAAPQKATKNSASKKTAKKSKSKSKR